MISTLGKRSEDSTTGKRNISTEPFGKMIPLLLLLITLKTLVTTSNGTILARLTTIKEILFIQDLQPALNGNVSSEKLLLY